MYWYQTATKADLRKIVSEAVEILKFGPCSDTQKQCPGCSQEWIMAAGLLMFGPDVKKPMEVTEEPPPACC